MMGLLNKAKGLQHITRKNLLDFENKILVELDWNLNYVTPISFLERYQRIFEVDQEETN